MLSFYSWIVGFLSFGHAYVCMHTCAHAFTCMHMCVCIRVHMHLHACAGQTSRVFHLGWIHCSLDSDLKLGNFSQCLLGSVTVMLMNRQVKQPLLFRTDCILCPVQLHGWSKSLQLHGVGPAEKGKTNIVLPAGHCNTGDQSLIFRSVDLCF